MTVVAVAVVVVEVLVSLVRESTASGNASITRVERHRIEEVSSVAMMRFTLITASFVIVTGCIQWKQWRRRRRVWPRPRLLLEWRRFECLPSIVVLAWIASSVVASAVRG